jgi:carbohydrate diacid regulator
MNDLFTKLTEQIREATPRAFGVIDSRGHVLASVGRRMGIQLSTAAAALTASDGQNCVIDGYSFRLPDPHDQGESFDYAVFVEGADEHAFTVSILAGIALKESKSYESEKNDRSLFFKNLVSENTLISELFARAQELRISLQVRRCLFLIRQIDRNDSQSIDVVRGLFPDKQENFVFMANDSDIVLIKEFGAIPSPGFDSEAEEYEVVAQSIIEALSVELFQRSVVGIGSPSDHLRELPERYREAQVAIEVGKVFNGEKPVMRYDNLGIARIIYHLPTTLCEHFLTEVFKKNSVVSFDPETLYTISKFFENSLNVSETSRKLFVHRNTLVYRLEKIKRLTGLDLREFEQAIVFQVALMVRKYLDSQK